MVFNLAGALLGYGGSKALKGDNRALVGGVFAPSAKSRKKDKQQRQLMNLILGQRLGEVQQTRDILNQGIEQGGFGFDPSVLTGAQRAAQGQAGITLNRLNERASAAASARGALRSGATATDLGQNEAIVNQALQQTLANIAMANAQQKAQSFDRLLQQRQGLDIFNVGLVQDELSRRRQMQAQQSAQQQQALTALASVVGMGVTGGFGGAAAGGAARKLMAQNSPTAPITTPSFGTQNMQGYPNSPF